MGNKIRIKQIDLQGIISASGQVDLLSASNYVSFVTQLDTTMSSDVELAAVSSSISQSIYTINQIVGSGLISGSSQLTSSYDTRYILSGSITQTTWDNIDGKPSGLVSQSTDLTPLNSKTGSYATTGSNVFIGNQIITGSVSILIPGGTAYAINENPTPNNEFWAYIVDYPAAQNVAVGWTATIVGGGTYTVTAVNYQHPFNKITLSDGSLQMGYRIGINFSKSSKLWEFNTAGTLTGLPSGLVSGSQQISDFGFITGSYATINQYNSLTQSINVISGSVVNLTNTIDTGSYVVTSSFGDFTSSYFTDSASVDTRITTEKGRIDAILSASNANTDTFAEIVTLINSVDTANDNAFASFYTSSNSRISSLENATSSYETKGSSIISGSSQLTSSFDTRYTLSGSVQPLPSNLVSSSAQITAFGFVSSSTTINTASFATTGSNSFSGSQTITGSLIVSAIAVVSGGINVPTGSLLSLTSGSSISVDSSGAITGSLTGSVFGIGDVVAFSSSVDSRIKNIISTPAGTISGSSQLTSSFDTRYTLSGSVQPLPSGLISGSSQLTSSYDSRYSLSGSILTSFSSSVDNRLDTLEATIISGSINYIQVLGNRRTNITTTGVSIISGSITTSGNPVQVMVTGDANPTSTGWTRLQLYRGESTIGNIIQVENEANQNVPYCLNIIDTPSAGTHTYSMRIVSGISGVFDFGEADGPLLTAVELKSNTQLPSGLISGSSQLTASYDTRYTLSGSVQPLPNGLISGSSQLTASYDTRYTLSGSVVSGTTPAGTVSGSSQLTSSFDGRYVQTGSFNSLTASFNSFTASNANTSLNTFTSSLNIWSSSLATTGSNSFNGNQTITGSLIITTGSFFASQILANTSSLYLTSGSNLYVQNNGLVEITGSLRVSGSTISLSTSTLQVGTGSGDEGGEILLAKSITNNSLTGSGITIDSYQNRLRIFEQGGDARGVYIDLTKTPGGVSGELMWKASGMVNAGTFVTLDNIKATVTSSGNRGLSIAAVSTNFSANISAYYAMNGGVAGTATNNFSVTTTPTSTLFTWNFTAEGDGAYYTIVDKTNNRMYRVTLMIGASYNNNFISIERLY